MVIGVAVRQKRLGVRLDRRSRLIVTRFGTARKSFDLTVAICAYRQGVCFPKEGARVASAAEPGETPGYATLSAIIR